MIISAGRFRNTRELSTKSKDWVKGGGMCRGYFVYSHFGGTSDPFESFEVALWKSMQALLYNKCWKGSICRFLKHFPVAMCPCF